MDTHPAVDVYPFWTETFCEVLAALYIDLQDTLSYKKENCLPNEVSTDWKFSEVSCVSFIKYIASTARKDTSPKLIYI